MEITGYRIDRIIGQGGMATVYRAEQEALHRPVALKVMHAEYAADTEFAHHFLAEGRTAARLNDPQIVTVHDTGVDNGHYYLAMEYLPGGTLQRKIRDGLSLERALGIAERIGLGLAYAHSRNIIHCDIKPQNILFRASGEPVITDFGIARVTSQSSPTGGHLGSPRYMSPEQIHDEPLDARSDLYSLGIILYEMLTGRPPYEANDPLALAELHLHAPIPRLPAHLAEFQPLIDRLLAKTPDQRYTITEQFLEALKQCQHTHWLNRHGGTMPIPVPDDTIVRSPASDPPPDATLQIRGIGDTALSAQPVRLEDRPTEPITTRRKIASDAPEPDGRHRPPAPAPDESTERPTRPHWLLAIPVVLIGAIGGGYYWWLQSSPETVPDRPPARITPDLSESAPVSDEVPPRPVEIVPPPTVPENLATTPGINQPATADPPLDDGELTATEEAITTLSDSPPSSIESVPPVTERLQESSPTPTVPPAEPVAPSFSDELATIRELITNGDYERSLAMLDRTLSEMPAHESLQDLRRQLSIQQILQQARDLREQNRLEDAVAVLNRGLDDFPDEPTLLILREEIGTILIENRNRVQADQHLQRARELYGQGRLDEALEQIEQGLQSLPRHAELRILRAQITVDKTSSD